MGVSCRPMRREQVERFLSPYGDSEGSEVDYRLARRLGVYIPKAIALEREVLADLDEHTFGIGWWAPHPGTSRRILISDYLWQCCHSIQQNVTEAALHLVEAQGAWDAHAQRLAGGLKVAASGEAAVELPAIASPMDELSGELFQLHVGGLMRAVGSALDCLGGVIVGVAGLKTDLLKADLGSAFKELDKLSSPSTAGERLQAAIRIELAAAAARCGPEGWIEWASDFRNMLVHRGRRTRKDGGHLVPSPILDAQGHLQPRLQSFPLLPRAPRRSDVQVMLDLGTHDHLTEDGLFTLAGTLQSTCAYIAAATDHLGTVWQTRRAAPTIIDQPAAQWKEVGPAPRPFGGYDQGTAGTSFSEIHLGPVRLRRLRAAALTSEFRHLWETFD